MGKKTACRVGPSIVSLAPDCEEYVSYANGLDAVYGQARPGVPDARAFDVFVDCFQRVCWSEVTSDIVALSPPLIAEAHEFERTASSIDQSSRSVA
jgi:hypothetical protein